MREPDQHPGVAELKPAKGEVICAGTGQGNIAVLVMERVDVDSSDDLTAVLAQVTVWSKSPSGSSLSQWPHKQWGPGTLLITSNNTDLDSVPPNVNSDGASADMSISADGQGLGDSSELVAWTSASTPTAAECANLISTQGVAELKPAKGEVICAGTGQGNIAVLVMERVDVDSSDDLTAVLAQVTVWSNSE